jgi:hypothetical protein
MSGIRVGLCVMVLSTGLGGAKCGSGDHPTTPIRSRVVARSPLPLSECVRQTRGWGYSLTAARPLCVRGASALWFHATFTNASAPPTYIRCAFTAWDENERQLFHGYLPLAEVSFPAGVYLERHEKRSIDWYFDAHAHPQARRDTQVARYSSSCTRVMNPPI